MIEPAPEPTPATPPPPPVQTPAPVIVVPTRTCCGRTFPREDACPVCRRWLLED